MSAPPISALQRLIHARTLSTLRTTDTILLRLSKLLSTPTGIDSLLLTLQYTLKFLSARLTARLEAQLTLLATTIATKAQSTLLPGESVLAQVPAPASAQRLAKLAEGSKNLSGKISDVRMFMRLWGLVGMYAWGRATYVAGPQDPVFKAIAWGQIASMTVYQLLENSVYLASYGILNTEGWVGETGAARKGRWTVWSCQCWVAYIAMDFARLGYEGYKERNGLNDARGGDGEKEDKFQRLHKKKLRSEMWWRQFIKQSAYFPMAIQYSISTPFMSDGTIGALGMIAGLSHLPHYWRQTA